MRALSTYGFKSVAPIGVKHKLTFLCERCNNEWNTIEEASACEKQCAAVKQAQEQRDAANARAKRDQAAERSKRDHRPGRKMSAKAKARREKKAAEIAKAQKANASASLCPSGQIKKSKVERSASRADESHLEDAEEDDDVPKVGDRVEFVWNTKEDGEHDETRQQWYAGTVCSVTDTTIVVLYDDGQRHPHKRKGLRERYNWRYEDIPSQRLTNQGINRGSGRRGQKDRGRKRQKGEADSDDDMDQYDRIPGDTIIGKDRVAQYLAEEHEYEVAKMNENSGGRTQGYKKDGFVVSDDDEPT